MDNTNDLKQGRGQSANSNGEALAAMAENYKHINGWGIDADPQNEPTYPMKNWTGDDHKRSNYTRPTQQPMSVEILHSNERPTVSAVFGTVSPPSGLSGMLRRFAFKYSEESLKHWFALVMADRINVVEGIVDDFKHGTVPNILKEKGMNAAWEHNRKAVVKNVIVGVAAASILFLIFKNKKSKKISQREFSF